MLLQFQTLHSLCSKGVYISTILVHYTTEATPIYFLQTRRVSIDTVATEFVSLKKFVYSKYWSCLHDQDSDVNAVSSLGSLEVFTSSQVISCSTDKPSSLVCSPWHVVVSASVTKCLLASEKSSQEPHSKLKCTIVKQKKAKSTCLYAKYLTKLVII